MVVPDDAPPSQASIKAASNGASSVLVMLDGSFDPATAVYENRARMFMVRLLDTTQVAIDVGRERMGTDKRPGTVDVMRNGPRILVSIKDQARRPVVRADVELVDPGAYLPEVAKAAATAGIQLRPMPRGTEYVYPAVARIGRGPVVSWDWRSDVVPQLQPVLPGTVVLDSGSEEGQMLLSWGFMPKVLGYVPNVRGVITGLADRTQKPPATGLVFPQGTRYRGALPSMAAEGTSDVAGAAASSVPLLRAAIPGGSRGVIEQLPVLRLVTQGLEPGLRALPSSPAHEEQPSATKAVSGVGARWAWNTTLLGTTTVMLRKEVVGVVPEGLRVNWHVIEGTFVGPGVEAKILPGAVDWSCIRRDGVCNVNVEACLETPTGQRIYTRYGGVVDLGPDGFARAVRGEFDPFPPVVVAPVYATADPQLQWLNRIQCIGLGRVDMSKLRLELDMYAVHVGDRLGNDATKPSASGAPPS